MSDQVVIVCVRDPDASNDFTVHGEPAPLIIDVDLGMNLADEVEFLDWAEGQVATAGSLPSGHPAREQVLDIVDDQRGTNHAHLWPDLDSLLRHLAERLESDA